MHWLAFILFIIIILLIGFFAWCGGQQDSRICRDAGYEDYHEDSTGGFCYVWANGLKILTPFGDVK